MKAAGVWFLGVAGLAVLSAVAVTQVLPRLQGDLQATVDAALKREGLTSVKATVHGQDVTLHAADDAPAHLAELAQAKTAVAGIRMPDEPVVPHGGTLINRPVNRITLKVARPQVVAVVSDATESKAMLAASTGPASSSAASPPLVEGDRAVAVVAGSESPRVAGDVAYEAAASAANACEDRVQIVVAGRRVDFQPGTYDLDGMGQQIVADVFRVMQSCPARARLTVSGYTDNAGDPLVNQIISQARARAVADALVGQGLASDRVTVRGYGGTLPVADNTTPEGREKNRRIVFSVNAG